MSDDKIFLDKILEAFPPRQLDATDKLVVNMRGLVADLKSRITRLAVNEAKTYGWALDKVDRLDQIICATLYLSAFAQIPEAFFDADTKGKAKKFGIGLRRFMMSHRLNPDKLEALAGLRDAAVFLIGCKELIR